MTRLTAEVAQGGLLTTTGLRSTVEGGRAERMKTRMAELDANHIVEMKQVVATIQSIRDNFLGTRRNANQ